MLGQEFSWTRTALSLLTTSLRGLWVSGYLPRAMADRAQGRRPDNRPGDTGGLTQTPGWHPEEKATLVTATRGSTLKPAWTASMREGAGAQRPHCAKGRDPRTPASWRHFAVASCRGNRRRALDRRMGKIDLRPCGRHSVHRQCAELPCCPSAAWYPPSYFSEDRRVPFLRCRRIFPL